MPASLCSMHTGGSQSPDTPGLLQEARTGIAGWHLHMKMMKRRDLAGELPPAWAQRCSPRPCRDARGGWRLHGTQRDVPVVAPGMWQGCSAVCGEPKLSKERGTSTESPPLPGGELQWGSVGRQPHACSQPSSAPSTREAC